VYPGELSADFVISLEHERVEAEFVTPARGRQPGWSTSDDQNVVHLLRGF
jgi:hypothetical protein